MREGYVLDEQHQHGEPHLHGGSLGRETNEVAGNVGPADLEDGQLEVLVGDSLDVAVAN